jgi:hypothetical protein
MIPCFQGLNTKHFFLKKDGSSIVPVACAGCRQSFENFEKKKIENTF